MCSTGPCQFRVIEMIDQTLMLLSSSNGKNQPYTLLRNFSRGSVPKIFVVSYFVTYCIYMPENRNFVFIFAQFMMSAYSRIRFAFQIVFVCLYITQSHYRHCANLSDDIEVTQCMSDIFLSAFSGTKAFDSQIILRENVLLNSNLRYVIIASDNGLAPIRHQAVIWTSDGLIYWCVCAPYGLSELRSM